MVPYIENMADGFFLVSSAIHNNHPQVLHIFVLSKHDL